MIHIGTKTNLARLRDEVTMSADFQKAYRFLFDETYRMWSSDLEKIFGIGTRGTRGGCNLSSCILVLIGIESFSKFFSNKKNDVDAFVEFVDTYFPAQYRGRMRRIYQNFRHGLAHNYYPKSEFKLKNASHVAFGLDEQRKVVALSRIKRDLDNCRARVLRLDPPAGRPYVIVPQVLFLDTVNVMEALKRRIKTDAALQGVLVSNYKRVRTILRHAV